jgi:hypothetical protein
MKDLMTRLRDGVVYRTRRHSGDTHTDLGGSVDEDATDAIMAAAVEEIERLCAELTFVIEDDHVIRYAGTELAKSRKSMIGRSMISVWRSGVYMGAVSFDGVWIYRTQECELPNFDPGDERGGR